MGQPKIRSLESSTNTTDFNTKISTSAPIVGNAVSLPKVSQVQSKCSQNDICRSLMNYLYSLEKLRENNGSFWKVFTSKSILSFIECVLIVVLIVLVKDIVQIAGTKS